MSLLRLPFYPFVLSAATSVVLVVSSDGVAYSSVLCTLLRLFPIVYLVCYVNYSQNSDYREAVDNFGSNKFSRLQLKQHLASCIYSGLICSVVGDMFMVREESSIHQILGLLCFTIAHLCYAYGIGFDDWNASLGLLLYVVNAAIGYLVYCKPSKVIKFALAIYGSARTIVIWRSVDRYMFYPRRFNKNFLRLLGLIFFLISDTTLGFVKYSRPNYMGTLSQTAVLSTYYIAQGLLAYSAI